MAEDIAVEMHDATLPAGFRQVISEALDLAAARIRGDQLDTLEAGVDKVKQERRPAGLVLLGTLADAEDLATPPRSRRSPPVARHCAPRRAQVRVITIPSR